METNTRLQEIFFLALCKNLIKNFKNKEGLKDYFKLVTTLDENMLYNLYLNLKENNPILIDEVISLIKNENVSGIRRLSKFFLIPEAKLVTKIKEIDEDTFLPFLNEPILKINDFVIINGFMNSHCLFNKKTSLINKFVLD